MSYFGSRPGSGSGTYNPVYAETPAGTIDGTNDAFSLSLIPSPSGSLQIYLNGMLQQQGLTNDYVLSGLNITFSAAPTGGSTLLAFYNT